MLFVEAKTLRHALNSSARIHLLQELNEKNVVPVIRSARLTAFDLALSGSGDLLDIESEIARNQEQENTNAYINGDLFCQDDHVIFLTFDDDLEDPHIRAGIVYESSTAQPFRKLDAFCDDVLELLLTVSEASSDNAEEFPKWEHGKASMPRGFERFVARQDSDSLFTSGRRQATGDRLRAISILEDTSARVFLRRAKEAHVEGYAAKLLSGEAVASYGPSIERLTEAGLVEREVQVSCRKTGHALFRLPSANALAVVTVSDATCSECGAPVADEKVEEVIAPTRLAAALLEDGSWLISRIHQVLRELGIPESEIAVGPSELDGYGQMMVNISGEPFLIVARDGDLTPSFARWAIDLEIETEASHLVVVATGRVHKHAGALLHNHARRRIRAGRDFELILADDATAAATELRHAFERVSQRVLAEHLCDLDSGLGFNISRLIATKFKFRDAAKVAERESHTESELVTFESRPLSLAAGASASVAEVVGPEEFIVEEPHTSFDENNQNNDVYMSSGVSGFQNEA